MVLVGGCVEGAEDPPARIHVDHIDQVSAEVEQADEVDLCALASQLDANNVCSLICDPDAMADFLIAGGMQTGKCVQLRCELPGIEPILVGVCLSN